MDKIELTPEICSKIKEWRLKFNVKSIDLANHIDRSAAYITKLEKGDIKQIDRELLIDIVMFISDKKDAYEKFAEDFAEDFGLKSKTEKLEDHVWFLNFDTVERIIPINHSLIQLIKNQIYELNIDTKHLCEYINKNEDISDLLEDDRLKNENLQKNIWYRYSDFVNYENADFRYFIIIQISENELNGILNETIKQTNYMTLLATVYHLYKYKAKMNNDETEHKILHLNAEKFLLENKFYKLIDKARIIEQASSEAEKSKLLSEFDLKNLKLVNQIIEYISFISDLNIKYTNEKLENIAKNTSLDTSFALGYMGIDISTLNNIPIKYKKEFIVEVNNLVDKYKDKSEIEEDFEKY